MARRYNPAREYLEPVSRSDPGTEYLRGDGRVYNEDGVEMGSSFTSSADMSDSGVASGIALTARREYDRMNADAEIARLKADILDD